MIVFFWLLNFSISWFNAWSVGTSWNHTKAVGGIPHFLSWMGAIMSSLGFTWCYSLILGFLGTVIPITDSETGISAPLLLETDLQVFFDLAFLVLIFPIIGCGFAIMTHSWYVFWKKKNVMNGLVAGYNTAANINNIMVGFSHTPDAFSNVGDFFSNNDDDFKSTLILYLIAVAIFGGILTTYAIIKKTSREF